MLTAVVNGNRGLIGRAGDSTRVFEIEADRWVLRGEYQGEGPLILANGFEYIPQEYYAALDRAWVEGFCEFPDPLAFVDTLEVQGT